jgi:hypothetical protein
MSLLRCCSAIFAFWALVFFVFPAWSNEFAALNYVSSPPAEGESTTDDSEAAEATLAQPLGSDAGEEFLMASCGLYRIAWYKVLTGTWRSLIH